MQANRWNCEYQRVLSHASHNIYTSVAKLIQIHQFGFAHKICSFVRSGKVQTCKLKFIAQKRESIELKMGCRFFEHNRILFDEPHLPFDVQQCNYFMSNFLVVYYFVLKIIIGPVFRVIVCANCISCYEAI